MPMLTHPDSISQPYRRTLPRAVEPFLGCVAPLLSTVLDEIVALFFPGLDPLATRRRDTPSKKHIVSTDTDCAGLPITSDAPVDCAHCVGKGIEPVFFVVACFWQVAGSHGQRVPPSTDLFAEVATWPAAFRKVCASPLKRHMSCGVSFSSPRLSMCSRHAFG
jgi:hypothetical protein